MNGYEVRAAFPGARATLRPKLRYVAMMLKKWWGMPLRGVVSGGSVIVTHRSRWWLINDNGGELNVWAINDEASLASVPYEQGSTTVPIGRVAWFCAMTIMGEPITDYGTNAAVDDLTLTVARSA